MQEKLTVQEAADYLGISRGTVWALLRNGELPAMQNPIDKRQKLIPGDAVQALLDRGRSGHIKSALAEETSANEATERDRLYHAEAFMERLRNRGLDLDNEEVMRSA